MNAKVYLPSSWCRIFGLGSKPLFCMRWKLAVKKFFFSQIGQVPILISLFLTVQLLFWCIVRGLFSLVGTQSPFFLSYFYQAQKIETVLALNQEIDKMRSN